MANTYLTRTQGSTGSETKGTFSAWVTTASNMYTSYQADNEFCDIQFNSSDQLQVVVKIGGTDYLDLRTTRLFRDVSAFYHIVVVFDSTDSTQADRCKLYVNGTRETSFATNTNNVSSSLNMRINGSSQDPYIGSWHNQGNYFDGSMTHIHWIDGTAYDASTFAESDSVSGIWKPKTAPSVTYGTNGFFLKMENSGAMGTDSSGNSNTFTVSGTLTQNVDTPSNNFPTLNRLAPSQDNRTGGNGSLYTGDNSNNSWSSHPATMACESGKWYFEIKDETDWGSTSDSTRRYGIANLASSSLNQNRASATDVRFSDGDYAYAYMNASGVRHSGSTISGSTSTHPTFAEGDFIMVAMDLDNNKLYFGKNGTWLDSGDPTSGASGTGAVATLAAGAWAAYLEPKYGSDTASINFGQGYFRTAVAGTNADANGHGKFKYSVPSGYYAICTKNIKEFG